MTSCTCPNCQQPVQYDPNDGGQEAACPHCQFALVLPAVLARPVKRGSWLLAIVVAVVAVIGAMFLMIAVMAPEEKPVSDQAMRDLQAMVTQLQEIKFFTSVEIRERVARVFVGSGFYAVDAPDKELGVKAIYHFHAGPDRNAISTLELIDGRTGRRIGKYEPGEPLQIF